MDRHCSVVGGIRLLMCGIFVSTAQRRQYRHMK
uniref:Uncharacterized protein n=1 Tax=Arundo donax TaxID=35708 RepID=A0A0A9DQ14_ARUDO